MSSVTGAMMVPHPPLLLPNIGKGEEKKIAEIDAAYQEAARRIAAGQPDTVVIVTPHGPAYRDYIQISAGKQAAGDMSAFRDEEDAFTVRYDTELIEAISRLAQEQDLPAGTLGVQHRDLDHGTMIPLYYLQQHLSPSTRYVRICVGGPDQKLHYALGMQIAKAARQLGRKVAIVGSGDLSHCQKAGTHYGFKACGPAYDAKIMDIMGRGAFDELLDLSDAQAEEAMVCGQKPFCVMAGAMDGLNPVSENLGHSAFFGVGYGVCTYEQPQPDKSRHFLKKAMEKRHQKYLEQKTGEDPWVTLARQAVEHAVLEQNVLPAEQDVDPALLDQKAGVFVSLHSNGALRGCIGTIFPAEENVAREICRNAYSAALHDPRFSPVTPFELEDLEISVDVLGKPEPVAGLEDLDVHKYGVIVSKNGRRGLLLPDLEGVDTPEQQIAIAAQKAGLHPREKNLHLERFEVIRHQGEKS